MLCGPPQVPPRPPRCLVACVALPYKLLRSAKGYGAVARRHMRRGELVVQEAPRLCWSTEPQLTAAFEQLSEEEREELWQLEDAYGDPKTRPES